MRQTIEPLESRTLLSVAPALAARLEAAGFEKLNWHGHEVYAEPGEWLVSLRGLKGSTDQRLASAGARLAKVSARFHVLEQMADDGMFKVSAPPSVRPEQVSAALRRARGVALAEPNFAVWAQADPAVQSEPTDPGYPFQYALHNTGQAGGVEGADIHALQAWDLTRGSPDVVVAVIDTGVDYTHPDLAANMWVNPFEVPGDHVDNDNNGFVDDVYGADFAEMDGDPMDDFPHGTHVAGIIAAAADNGIGIAGVAPGVKIMALRFLTRDGFGGVSQAIDALHYAEAMKARGVNVVASNNSWGGAEFSQAMADAVRESGRHGMLFVAAAGNGGEDHVGDDNDVTPFYPASHDAPNLISVAATDRLDVLSGRSNFGRQSVDLGAPGVEVYSTLPGNTYGYLTGTSMAAPHVTAVAALAFSLRPGATWQQVRTAMLRGVDPLPTLAGKTVTGGRLDAAGALQSLMQPTRVVARQVFYNNSSFDGSAAANAKDDRAIAADKEALLPGGTASFANYTSYSRGLNGVMVDVDNLAGTPTADDFAFRVGSGAPGADWAVAPAPTSVTVRPGAGQGGSDRVTITWADGAIRNQWLQVALLARAETGLAVPDVFYFGNQIGETGNSLTAAAVDAIDLAGTRLQQLTTSGLAGVYDFNRDGVVNAVDLGIVRGRQLADPLALITAPRDLL